MCEMLGCLPNPGGLFQQEPRHIKLISTVLEAKAEYRKKEEERVDREAKLKDRVGPKRT